jgi:hypothetical protein
VRGRRPGPARGELVNPGQHSDRCGPDVGGQLLVGDRGQVADGLPGEVRVVPGGTAHPAIITHPAAVERARQGV